MSLGKSGQSNIMSTSEMVSSSLEKKIEVSKRRIVKIGNHKRAHTTADKYKDFSSQQNSKAGILHTDYKIIRNSSHSNQGEAVEFNFAAADLFKTTIGRGWTLTKARVKDIVEIRK